MKINLVKILILSVVAGIVMTLPQSAAAGVELKLIEPEKFRDIESVGFNQKKSIEIVNEKMQTLFQQLAEQYSDKQLALKIEITEIDLPGRVEHMVGPNYQDIRILKDSDIYKLYFKYQALSTDGKVVQQGNAEIKEFYNQPISHRVNRNKQLTSYFEAPLGDWFKKTFNH